MESMHKINAIRIFFVCFLMLLMSQNAAWSDTDDGYFLSLRQKGQLISSGLIQDKNGDWYNIWICPGYLPPYRYGKKYLFKTGSDFGEYFHAKKYKDLARDSKNAYRWAFDYCIHKFIIKDIPNTWKTNLQRADLRTKKRVFGWWFAYPWAVMDATAESVVRIPVGLTGSAIGTVWATAAVPVYYATNSSIKGVYHFSVHTVAIPAVGEAWNTIISPPMALFGQKPALSRVDGFWVKSLTHEPFPRIEAADSTITDDDLDALKEWAITLETVLDPYQKEYARTKIEAETAIRKIYENRREKDKKIAEEESLQVKNLRKDPGAQNILKPLSEGGFTAYRISRLRSRIRVNLERNGITDPKRVNRIIHLLMKYPPALSTGKGFNHDRINPVRINPVRKSVDIVNDAKVPPHWSPSRKQ